MITGTNHSQEEICIQALLLWRQKELSSKDTNQSLLHSLSAVSVSGYTEFISGCPTPGGVHGQVGWDFKQPKWKVTLLLAVGLELDLFQSPFQPNPFHESMILETRMEYRCQMREMYL